MNPHRTRDAILAVIGFAAVLIYILACASFSPDDSKVLFPSWDPATGSLSLSVYDRTSRVTESLLVLPAEKEGRVRPGWTADGRGVVALWSDSSSNKRLQVALLPFKTKEPARLLGVWDVDEVSASLMYPPQVLGSSMFLTARSNVVRLDLTTGIVKEREIGDDPVVVVAKDRVFYQRKLPSAGESNGDRWEIGRLDPDTLACTPGFQTSDGDEQGPFTVSLDGSLFALESKKDDAFRILVFDGQQLIRTLPFGAAAERLELGDLQWSPDKSTLYAVYVKPLGDDSLHQFGVFELPVNGGPGRQIPLFMARDTEDMDTWAFQIDLSHDGKMLAGASTYVWSDEKPKLQAADLALYLVDLGRADRRVTKIPIPPPKPRPQAERK